MHIKTPLIESIPLSSAVDGRVWLKMEAMQPSGSFKTRGIGYACQQYVAEGACSLVSSSGGNAGLAVAYAGRQLNIPVTVVVPETTKKRAIELIKAEQANVIVTGNNWDEAHQHAISLTGGQVAYIHPFDDPRIWQGHASLVDEIAESGLQPDIIVLSVGGGGLLCGIVQGLKKQRWDIPVLAVETEGAHSFHASVTSGCHIAIDSISSIATSLGAKKVAKQAFEITSSQQVISHVVTDQQAISSCWRFLDDHRVLVEPACGASLSAVYDGCPAVVDKQTILLIVCGGVGITIEQLQQWRQR